MPTKPLSSLLYQAIQRNNITFITSLLSSDSNIKTLLFYKEKMADHASPLHYAAANGKTEALNALLSHEKSAPFIKDMF